ncbi:MerR family transcriptional regulator [Lacisediminihabitans sp.]|uniref:MerR family transcriptional regulator n=1 Tax=Lacisediminihabitans sp. TaxID=2787631 RepID=UPI00374C90EE
MVLLIGEVSQRAGISARMLRHYDSAGIVTPTGRTTGGYREYSPADIRRLFFVESLRSLGMSLRDVRRALDDPHFSPSALVGELIANTQERITRDEELLRRLRQVDASEPAEWTDVLRIVSLTRGLDSEDPSRRQQSALSAIDEATSPVRLLAEALLVEEDPNVAGALRWALRRSHEGALAVLAPALDSPEAAKRQRAVAAVAELETDEAAALLTEALAHTDPVVRGHAALTLGARGDASAVPVLIGMVSAGDHDVEAAERLGTIASENALADQIANLLVEQLDRRETAPDARLRLVQALAELPGPISHRALERLTEDADPRIAMTALFLLRTVDDG